jgi:hypothetical protein
VGLNHSGLAKEILPGQGLNINCLEWSPGASFSFQPNERIAEGTVSVWITYNAVALWIIPFQRSALPTKFTWFAKGTTFQWGLVVIFVPKVPI